MDSQERFENMFGLVEAHQYEWTIWQAAERQEPDTSVVKRIATQMGWTPTGTSAKPIGYIQASAIPVLKRGGIDTIFGDCHECADVAVFAAEKVERAQESAGVRMTDDQIREIWMRENGTTEQDSPLAILDFARAVIAANKEPQP